MVIKFIMFELFVSFLQVGWNLHDKFLVTAVTDHSLKVWDAFTGALVHVLVVSGFCKRCGIICHVMH